MGKNIEAWIHLEVDSGSDGFFIAPGVSEYVKKKLDDISKIIEITGPFKVTQIVSNFIPVGDVIGNPREYLKWNNYIRFLVDWAISHKDLSFSGMCPPSFDEWKDNDDKCDDVSTECLSSKDNFVNDEGIPSDDACDPHERNRVFPIYTVDPVFYDGLNIGGINFVYPLVKRWDTFENMGKRIRYTRENLHFSQADVKKRSTVPVDKINELENGICDIDIPGFWKISNALSVFPYYLLFGNNLNVAPVLIDPIIEKTCELSRYLNSSEHYKTKDIISRIEDNDPECIVFNNRSISAVNPKFTGIPGGIMLIAVSDFFVAFSIITKCPYDDVWYNEGPYISTNDLNIILREYLKSPGISITMSQKPIEWIESI